AAPIGEEIRTPLGEHPRLVLHVLAAAGHGERGRHRRQRTAQPAGSGQPRTPNPEPRTCHSSTSTSDAGENCSRNARVSIMENLGSVASRQRKNLSVVAPLRKLGALKSGW